MAFPRKLLNEGEELVLDLRPHWIYLAPSLGSLIASVIVGLVVILGMSDGTFKDVLSIVVGILVLGCLVWFGAKYLQWTTTNFVLTGDRILSRRGIIAKAGMEIPLERINTVTFSQSVFERLVGAGDLGIESASQGGRENFSDIRSPAHVQREIYVQMESNSGRGYAEMARATAGAIHSQNVSTGGPSLSLAEQLEKLDALRRNGVLSEEEFQAQKARLLNG